MVARIELELDDVADGGSDGVGDEGEGLHGCLVHVFVADLDDECFRAGFGAGVAGRGCR